MIEPLLFHTLPIFSHKRQLHPLLVLESFQNEVHFFKESRIRDYMAKCKKNKENRAAKPESSIHTTGSTSSGTVRISSSLVWFIYNKQDLCKVSVWKSGATKQTDQYKIIALPTHPESVPINALERPTPQAARIILMWPLEIFA
ncbi:hypothetical protein P8452_17350 [Trifolium repens]|nr:hypothetical protein P8452_17350 [Trifolium repens]